jgi:outer membrane cobalamin receptor
MDPLLLRRTSSSLKIILILDQNQVSLLWSIQWHYFLPFSEDTIMRFLMLLLTFLTLSPASQAEDPKPIFETVVQDFIFNSSSRIVIDEKTIKESRSPNVTTLLAAQANVTITSTPFQPNSIYIRGGDSSHVLILIDGIPFYDASTIQRTIDLNSLDIKSIRKIEIIKGSQTVLYGGQALSGVIKIDTIPEFIGVKTTLSGRLGTQATTDISAFHSNITENDNGMVFRGHGSWSASRSPVLDSRKTYERNNWNGEGTYVINGKFQGYLKANYIQDLNLSPSTSNQYKIIDADDFEIFTRQLGFSTSLRNGNAPWSPRLSLSTQNSLRTFEHPLSATNSVLTDQHYGANLQNLRADLTPIKSEKFTAVAGASYTREDFLYRDKKTEISNSFSEQRGLFLKGDYNIDSNFNISLGGRLENWDNQNAVSTYQVGLIYQDTTRLEMVSGYKIPSLFQLYSTYGNPNLEAERAIQYSFSQDWKMTDNQQLSLTIFKSQFSNLIITQGGFPNIKYTNVSSSESFGGEVTYTIRDSDLSSWLFAYGYQEPRDLDNNRWLMRRPLVNGSVRYVKRWDKHSTNFEVLGAGERLDRRNSTTIVSLPGYVVTNASYSYSHNPNLTTYLRLNNLFDNRYQETFSYHTEGFIGLVGIEYSL